MSEEFLHFILALVIVISAAKASGYLSTRLGQPSVLGELLAGLILGPTVFDMLHTWPMFAHDEVLGETLTMMGELGVIFLMMLAGLELHLSELLRSGRVAAFAGVLGVLLPLGLGWGTASLFGVGTTESVFIGLALSATSVSISAQTLMELGVLRSRVGLGMLGAAVFDDVLVILLLSISAIMFGGSGEGGVSSIFMTDLDDDHLSCCCFCHWHLAAATIDNGC
jgi:Kef-type K+ transport system membrane component KefB